VVGGDLDPGTLLAAYRSGLFPMPLGRRGRLGWFSPDPRGVLPVEAFHVSRSLRRSARHYLTTVDADFAAVVAACGDPARPHGWITGEIARAYLRLHELGWAHSVEVWDGAGRLVGGVYGVAIGSFFAGESMFHHATDASKVALWRLAEVLAEVPSPLFDVQWSTPHLASLGVVEVSRADYLVALGAAVADVRPDWTRHTRNVTTPMKTWGK
jgi:leucyl/phenylalanyl-tRNA---protein transferase